MKQVYFKYIYRRQGCSEKIGDQYRDETANGVKQGQDKLPFRSPYVSFSHQAHTELCRMYHHTQNIRFRGVEPLMDAREKAIEPDRGRFQTCVYHLYRNM